MDQPRTTSPTDTERDVPRDLAAEIERARADDKFVDRLDRLMVQHAETLERLAE